MDLVNRAAIVVKPKQPYVDWANSLDEDGPRMELDDPNQDHNVYLVDELFDPGDLDDRLTAHFATIFEQELRDWHLREADWPQQRDLVMFHAWFSVEVHSMVIDLSDNVLDVEYFEG